MYLENLYNEINSIAVELYQNNGEAFSHVQAKMGELMEFLSSYIDTFPEKAPVLQQSIAQLSEAVSNVDKILLADILYYDICELIDEYAQYVKEAVHKSAEVIKERYIEQEVRVEADCYALNRAAFEKCKNQDYKACIEYCDNFNCEEDSIAIDAYANMAICENNRWWRLNSFYNSRETAKFIEKQFLTVDFNSIVYIYGIGNMDYINVVLKSLPFDTVVIIYEPNEKIFALNMHYNDMSSIANREHTFLFVENINDSQDDIQEYIPKYYNSNKLKETYSWILPNYDVIYNEKILQKKNCFDEFTKSLVYFNNTRYVLCNAVSKNQIDNLRLLTESVWISDLKKNFEKNIEFDKVPAIIVAAGPSLNKNIEYLRQAKGKAFIFAVDSAVRMLDKYDIEPDAVITVDPIKQKILFENRIMENAPLFYCLECVHDCIKDLKGKKIFYNNNRGNSQLLKYFDKDIESFEIQGSVSNVAIGLAEYLGFNTVITVGLDLAFEGDKKHADVVYDDGGVNEAEEWAYTYVKGQNGEQLLTYDNFVYYKQIIEKFIEEKAETFHLINASQGGALIEGAECMSLEAAISKYCLRQTDIKGLIENCNKSLSEENDNLFIQYINSLIEECLSLSKSFRNCAKMYEELLNSHNSDTMLKKLDKIKAEEDYQDSCAVMNIVKSLSQRETDSIKVTGSSEHRGTSNEAYEYIRGFSKKGLSTMQIYLKNIKTAKEMLSKYIE